MPLVDANNTKLNLCQYFPTGSGLNVLNGIKFLQIPRSSQPLAFTNFRRYSLALGFSLDNLTTPPIKRE